MDTVRGDYFPVLDFAAGTASSTNDMGYDNSKDDPLFGVGSFIGSASYAWDDVIDIPLDLNLGLSQNQASGDPQLLPEYTDNLLTPQSPFEADATQNAVWNALQVQNYNTPAYGNGLLSLPEQWTDTCPVSLPAIVAQTVPFAKPGRNSSRLPAKDTIIWENSVNEEPLKLFSVSTPMSVPSEVLPAVAPVVSCDAAENSAMQAFTLASQTENLPAKTCAQGLSPNSVSMLANSTKRRAKVRLHECTICHKMFERSYNYRMHLATHDAVENRLKPFVCPFPGCEKKFARKHDKNRHYQGVHLHIRKNVYRTLSPMATEKGPLPSV